MTPAETVQMIGESGVEVPETVSVDLGVVDIFISDYGNRIEFGGHGERTDVGQSLPSTTEGMS
ncbi:hypothetical protein LCGC14_2560550, partial [marine sediment metagenome]